MRCGAHILGLIVRDGLQEVHGAILRIRSAVRYVRSSPSRLKRFRECLEHQKVETKAGLCLDVETRWNSTFLMLQSAVALKKGFDMLELEDEKYVVELTKICKAAPSDSDWAYATALSPILQYFYDATVNISGSKYVTGNTYMKEIFGVGWMIMKMDTMGDEYKKAMAEKMKLKFYKYWGNFDNTNMMIYVAAVLDPQYKMRWVKWMIQGTYPNSEASCLITKITNALDKLFEYYTSLQLQESVGSEGNVNSGLDRSKDRTQRHVMMDEMFDDEESVETDSTKSELEYYLDYIREDRKNPDFDILHWWNTTGSKYKVLSLMARDMLAIHVSTVTSESAFSADWYGDNDEDLRVEEMVVELEYIKSDIKEEGHQDTSIF
ncbi:PREDICTED: zinc finger BED domain-containing protein RICESLEEPER 2-like [Camelina sativa]|uniref:Zinc finger BED domain-containing protein RICESLEEPER 2-like n=1 Tax=Camelina sativa TaxID=90675 RepID=A0ABM1Q7J8_CAMSA|nr:PREDICTED: zinc finger BED domain-containing protein RICESLEEPER 2-like [Camelina sativa]